MNPRTLKGIIIYSLFVTSVRIRKWTRLNKSTLLPMTSRALGSLACIQIYCLEELQHGALRPRKYTAIMIKIL